MNGIVTVAYLICVANAFAYDFDDGEYSSFQDYESYDDYDDDYETIINNNASVPLMKTTPTVFGAVLGDLVLLPCVTTSTDMNASHLIVRTWRRGDGDEYLYQDLFRVGYTENINLLSNGTLTVKVSSEKDFANYTCQVALGSEEDEVTHSIIKSNETVLEPPKLITGSKVFEVYVGETVYLPCEVSNSSVHQVEGFTRQWKKSFFTVLYVNGTSKYSSNNMVIFPNGTLGIDVNSAGDANSYICEITSSKATQQRVIHKILVFPKLRTKPIVYQDDVDDTVVLPCDVSYKEGLPNLDIFNTIRTWTRDGVPIYHEQVEISAGENVKLLLSGSLQIKLTSKRDFSEYSCSIVSVGGEVLSVTHKIEQRHNDLPDLLSEPVTVRSAIGGTVFLPCDTSARGYNVLRKWVKNRNTVLYLGSLKVDKSLMAVIADNGTLEVQIESEEDIAEYSCIVESSLSSETHQVTHKILRESQLSPGIKAAQGYHTAISSLVIMLYLFVRLM